MDTTSGDMRNGDASIEPAKMKAMAAEKYEALYGGPVLSRPHLGSYRDRHLTNQGIGAIASGLAHLGPEVEMGPHNVGINDDAIKHASLLGVMGNAEGLGSPSCRDVRGGA